MYRSGFYITPQRQGASCKDLLATFELELKKHKPRNLNIDGNCVSFSVGMFRMVSNWNLLTAITKGKITVEPESNRVTYCLSFMELVIIGTALVGIMGLFMAWRQNPHESSVCLVLSIFWLWLVGANYLITLVRFDRFMKRCLKNAGFSARKCRA